MSKTIEEWLMLIKDEEIREKALIYLGKKVYIRKSFQEALISAFCWDLTNERYDFWRNIHQNYKDYVIEENVNTLPHPLEVPTPDPVNPSHYKDRLIETIDTIEASMTTEAFRGYLKGNVLKYVTRYEQKGGLVDLNKANWYLQKLINTFATE